MLIGYARVSSSEQDTDLQRQALAAHGVGRVFEEKGSGADRGRTELARMLDQLRPGDVVVVWKLDRLARSLRDLLDIIETIGRAGADLRCLTDPIDTTSPAGRMVMHIIGAMAEFERGLIIERSRAGIEAARRRGVRFGRTPVIPDHEAHVAAKEYRSGRATLTGLARLYGCDISSVKRAIKRADDLARARV